MRKFIKKIALFILPLALLMYPVDLLLSNLLRRSSGFLGEMEVWNDIYWSNINCEIAVYGSSRAYVNFNPNILRDSLAHSVYNFGIEGLNFRIQYFRHLEYLKNNSPPKIIIHSVDIFNLFANDELYNQDQFLPYMLWNWDLYHSIRSLKGFNFYDHTIPIVRYNGKIPLIQKSISEFKNSYRNSGYKSHDWKWNEDFDQAVETLGNYSFDVDPELKRLFLNFLLECKAKEIEVVMVYAPIHIYGQQFIHGFEANVEFYREIARKNQLIFLDYTKDSLCYNRSYFYNSTHLNSIGADLFSKKMAHDLKQILDLPEKKK